MFPHTSVYTDVFLQISRCLESLFTVELWASIRLFSGMNPNVTLETIASGKGLPTAIKITFERSVTCVRSLMHFKVVLSSVESPTTIVTTAEGLVTQIGHLFYPTDMCLHWEEFCFLWKVNINQSWNTAWDQRAQKASQSANVWSMRCINQSIKLL